MRFPYSLKASAKTIRFASARLKRIRNNKLVLFALTLALATPTPAVWAEAPAPKQICSQGDLIAIRSSPGGSQLAQLYPRGCMELSGEKRENWVKVRIEGWVDEDRLPFAPVAPVGAENTTRGSAASDNGQGEQIHLTSSEILLGAADLSGKPTQAQILLRIVNKSGVTLRGWRGVLVARELGGRELFRYRVSDENTSLAPNASGELRLGWEKGDRAFDMIQARPANEIRIMLTQTTPLR